MGSNTCEEGSDLRRGPWTLEEDNLLIQFIGCYGEGRWNSLAKLARLRRTGKSCRLRWLNYLKPDIKRGNLSHHEQLLILELHSKWGNRWSKIAQHLPGRTDNEIKNYWRTRVQKQARQLKLDSNSTKFLEAIRLYWMPRLREKMDQNHSHGSSSSSSYSSSSSQFLLPCVGPQNQNLTPVSVEEKENPRLLTSSSHDLQFELANQKALEEEDGVCGFEDLQQLETNDFATILPMGDQEIDWLEEELGSNGTSFWDF